MGDAFVLHWAQTDDDDDEKNNFIWQVLNKDTLE